MLIYIVAILTTLKMEFKYLIIACCFAFTIFLVFKELKRNDKSRVAWRITASILMVLSFALLIIPISYTIEKEEPINELNLLTEGTTTTVASSLKARSYTLDSALQKANFLPDLAYHLKAHPNIKQINVYGYGLADQDLDKLKDYHISFHPTATPAGIITANWPKKLSSSTMLTVQGIYHNPTTKPIALKLYGMGMVLDSVTIKAQAKVNFAFSTQPKQTGNAIFKLIALQSNDTLSVDPVPFEVADKQPTKVLILASFPDFEYKFLKQWLYAHKYPVVFRSRISKDKYTTDFLNTQPVNVNQLTRTLLKGIDLLVVDEDELAVNKALIYNAVNNGMGLLIRSAKTNTYKSPSPTASAVSIKSADNIKFNNLPFQQTLFLKSNLNEQQLITDGTGKVLVASKLVGMGKVLNTTLAATYQWQLAGNQADYTRYWSLIFNKALRKEIAIQSFEIAQKWPSVNEKLRVSATVSDDKAPLVSVDSVRLSLRQNMELPFLWDGNFWPTKSGWSVLSIDKNIGQFYTYAKEEWRAAKSFEKLTHTAQFEAKQSSKKFTADKISYSSTEEVSKWWFLLVFGLMISFLWYEQRFLAAK
jgi:hypothetical protein